MSLVPLSSCNKHEKYMCNGQMAGTQTPTLSDVLFSIPLRQNQNNRPAANKNKITFPISIPDREKLQEKRLGKEPERNESSALHSEEPLLRQTVPASVRLMTDDKF